MIAELDAWQMELSGTSLIEASAGTGKTYTLTTLYLRLLVEEDLSPGEILVVTYTTAATAELRERVRSRIKQAIAAADSTPDDAEGERLRALALAARRQSEATGRPDPLRRALQEFDEAAIFTIHGFCQRTLQENAFESGLAFDAKLIEKPESLERTLAHDLWVRGLSRADPGLVEWLLAGAGKRWQFEPEALYQNLLRELGADEEMPIVPAPEADPPDAEAASASERAAAGLREWAREWSARRRAIADLLLGENDLNGNVYRLKTIEERWLPDLDLLAQRISERSDDASLAAIALPDGFAKLTASAIRKGTRKKGTPLEDPVFTLFEDVSQAVDALAAARERQALALRHDFVRAARAEARKRRSERHLLFFDDLLSELRSALRGLGGERLAELLRQRYRFALIDEFQDTDPVQYDIFREVWHSDGDTSKRRGLVLIGDPKQAIYSFRGADVFTYLAARGDAGPRAYGLPINYRSDAGLIAAVNALFAGRPSAFRIEEIEFNPVAPREADTSDFAAVGRSSAGLRVLFADRVRADEFASEEVSPEKPLPIRFGRTTLMDAVARDIADLLDSGSTLAGRPIVPSDVAVLCRRKIELQQVRRALEAVGVPCVDRGDADVFESREAWELLCVLQAMMRSGDPALLRGALATGAHGWGARELLALDDESMQLAELSERFAEYGRVWSQSGFGRAFETWRRSEGVTARLLAFEDGERRLTNWLHLAELLQRVASDRTPSRATLVAWLERAIASPEAREQVGSEASLLRLERDDQAVALVTLHRSKGLEYPIVYLPSLWEDARGRGPSPGTADEGTKRNPPVRYHDAESGRRTLDLAGHPGYADHLAQSEDEAFSEQLRLLYVGLTRARHQCVVAWGAIGTAFMKTPLAWLLHGPLAEGAGLDAKASAAELKGLGDADWWALWQSLGEAAGPGSVEVEELVFAARDRWQAPDPERAPLAYRAPTRRLDRPLRTTSFSALVREGHRGPRPISGPLLIGRDLDAEVDVDIESERIAGTPPTEPSAEGVEGRAPDLAARMHEFPRGAEAGTLLHEVLERVDFADYDAEEVRARGLAALEQNGLDALHVDQVLHVVASVARTPLRQRPAPFRLADVAPGGLRAEIDFTLVTPGATDGPSFTPSALAALLRSAPAGSPLERYAERAGRMSFEALRGFLRGFIDATFFDGERYYLVDYKSNHLGAFQSDYLPEALVEPMIEHDYVLQYLVYSVALDRHLSLRLADYDYEKHFGGAYYLFLRGLSESHEPGCGVFFDRPPRDIVRATSELMGLARAEAFA